MAHVADAPDKPVYLITGSDGPKVETAIARLRSHFEVESIETVTALDTSGEAAVGLCNAGSLFGDARLIVVTDVDGAKARRTAQGRLESGRRRGDRRLPRDPAPATVLALVAEELKSSSALWKASEKAGRGARATTSPRESCTAGSPTSSSQRGARAEPEAVAALIQLVGDDLRALKTEVDKLATWAGESRSASVRSRRSCRRTPTCRSTSSRRPGPLRDAARALAVSETIFERDPKPRRDAAPRLAGSLASHLGRLRALKQLAAEGVSSKEAAERLKLIPFYAEKLYRQAEGFSAEELDDAVVRLAELDGALKGQSKLAPDLEVQRTLVALARKTGVR